MEFPILVFGPGFLESGQQINRPKDAITLPNGERFGMGDWTNPDKLAEAEGMGVSFKRLVDMRENRPGYVQGDPINTVDGDTVVRTCGYVPEWTAAELLARRIAETKSTARTLLASTDWLVIRKTEKSKDYSQGVKDYRDAVRARSDAIEADLTAITDYDELLAYQVGGWPEEV